MIDDAAAADRDRGCIWAGVDELTKPTRRSITRDDGVIIWVDVPSLWDQSSAKLNDSTESGTGSVSGPQRSPIDLTMVEIRELISHATRVALIKRHQKPKIGTPAQLRQLAAYVVTNNPDRLWWYAYRFSSWARLLSTHLYLEHVATPVRLRNSACPICRVRQVTVDNGDGAVVVPALVVDFRGDLVRAAECSHCGAMWWRGVDLETLAATLESA